MRYLVWHECHRPGDFWLVGCRAGRAGRPARGSRKRCGACEHWDVRTVQGFVADCAREREARGCVLAVALEACSDV